MAALVAAIACNSQGAGPLPRAEASPELQAAFAAFKDTVAKSALNPDPDRRLIFHNIMIVKDGKVVVDETFDPVWPADRPQHVFSASKTFTALAVGLAVDDGLMTVDDVDDYLRDRGMYHPYPEFYSSRWIHAEGNEQEMVDMMREAAANGLNGTERECIRTLAGMCDGHATERVCELINGLV